MEKAEKITSLKNIDLGFHDYYFDLFSLAPKLDQSEALILIFSEITQQIKTRQSDSLSDVASYKIWGKIIFFKLLKFN